MKRLILMTLVTIPLCAQSVRQVRPRPAHAGPATTGTTGTTTGTLAISQPAIKEPGDSFSFDASTGRVVLVSRGKRFTEVKQNGAVARIKTKYSQAGDVFHYEWTLSNDAKAHQGIRYFMVDTPAEFANIDTDSSSFQSGEPAGWSVLAGPNTDEPSSRFLAVKSPGGPVCRADYDADKAHLDHQLAPGESAGPFSIDSRSLPGLLQAEVAGFKPDPPDGQPSDEEVLISHQSELSPWVLQQLAAWMAQNNHGFGSALLIGPKLKPRSDLFDQVRSELKYASTLPEFKDIAARLSVLTSSSDPSNLSKALKGLEANRTGIEKGFLDAIIFDLNSVI